MSAPPSWLIALMNALGSTGVKQIDLAMEEGRQLLQSSPFSSTPFQGAQSMSAPTLKSLLFAFEIVKKDGKITKPNHDKVDPLSTSIVGAILSANSGLATLLASCLDATRKATLFTLIHASDDHFTETRDVVISQLQVLIADLQKLTPETTAEDYKAWMSSIQAKAPAGAMGAEAGAVQPNTPVVLDPNTNEENLEAQLTDVLKKLQVDGDKKKVN
jgi:hypothetical protein